MKQKSITQSKTLTTCLLFISIIFVFGNISWVSGQTASELSQQRQAKQAQLDEILKKIADYQKQIKQQVSQANTLKNQISILNLQMAQTMAQIDATLNKIEAANIEIAEVTEKIVTTQQQIIKQKEVLKSLIVEINDLDQRSPLEIALENDNFGQFLDQVQYTASIQEQSQDALTKIRQLRSDLEKRQGDLKVEKANLDVLYNQLDVTKKSLATQQNGKQNLLDQTRSSEKAYQKLLSQSEEQQKALYEEINNLDAQISAKLGNKKLKANHGMLAYPMDGVMTQGYGNTGFRALGYTFHNGIDIAAPAGTPIYAAANGTVFASGTGKAAYGNWVAVKHNTGIFSTHSIVTLYAHMTSFVVRSGQVLRQGDLIGFEGNTGNTTAILYGPGRGYHIHFGVYDAEGFGVSDGAYGKIYGPYQVPYGAPYNPLDFL